MAFPKNTPRVVLKKDYKESLALANPWIFKGAVEDVEGSLDPGDIAMVMDSKGDFLAWGYVNLQSQIAVRVLSKRIEAFPDNDLIKNRILNAIRYRLRHFKGPETDAFRLVNSEGDFLPGLIVDRYSDTVVLQVLTMGMERFRDVVVSTIVKEIKPLTIWERSDTSLRKREGLEQKNCLIYGENNTSVIIRENGFLFYVDIKGGQKTGFYLDQRDSRLQLKDFASDLKILNCFSYTGGFSVYGLKYGARHVTNLDFSQLVMGILDKNLSLNNLSTENVQNIVGDAFDILRDMRGEGLSFDLIILDPPKFAQSQAQLKAAIRGYKDINLQAMHLLRPGGILMTFSCSGAVSLELFSKILAWSAIDAKRDIQILKRLAQPIDHPWAPGLPESEYLKGLILKVF
ncbi:MAG: class I SAM-dependent rRNA methyltransferase [Desulfatiglandales bacterium]